MRLLIVYWLSESVRWELVGLELGASDSRDYQRSDKNWKQYVVEGPSWAGIKILDPKNRNVTKASHQSHLRWVLINTVSRYEPDVKQSRRWSHDWSARAAKGCLPTNTEYLSTGISEHSPILFSCITQQQRHKNLGDSTKQTSKNRRQNENSIHQKQQQQEAKNPNSKTEKKNQKQNEPKQNDQTIVEKEKNQEENGGYSGPIPSWNWKKEQETKERRMSSKLTWVNFTWIRLSLAYLHCSTHHSVVSSRPNLSTTTGIE